MTRSDKPDNRELLLVRGYHKGYPFVGVGIKRITEGKESFVFTSGARVTWNCVSRWDYLSKVAPEYDIWAPTVSDEYGYLQKDEEHVSET